MLYDRFYGRRKEIKIETYWNVNMIAATGAGAATALK